MTGTRPSGPAPAAAAALDILELLATRGEPVPAATLSRTLGLPRSTVYHLLTVLTGRGYVTHLPEDHRYGLGVAAYELGSAYQRQEGLARLARRTVDRLVDRTGHNAHVAVLHGRDVLYILEQRAPGRPHLVTDVGVRLPATLTATGLAMLAALPAGQVRAIHPDRESFVQRDGRGVASLSALRSVLQQVRGRGYAVEDGLLDPALMSVANAVLDHTGHPVAAVAVTWAADRSADGERDALAGAVADAASDLTRRIRGRARA